MIRLADRALIESVDTDAEALLAVPPALSGEQRAPLLWDAWSQWLPFPVPLGIEKETREKDPAARLPRDGVRDGNCLVIQQKSGIAQVIPVHAGTRVLVECKGTFSPSKHLKASVIKLSRLPDFSKDRSPEAVRACMESYFENLIHLKPTRDGERANALITTNETTKALLLTVYTQEPGKAAFAWAKVTFLGLEGKDLPVAEKRKKAPFEAVVTASFLGREYRPSLLILPRTTITLKKMELPARAGFRCALGVADPLSAPVKVAVMGEDEEGNLHEVFARRVPQASEGRTSKGWFLIDKDLGDLSGRIVRFVITCDWVEEKGPGASPPRIYLGSPIIASRQSPSKGPGLNLVLISLDTLRYDHLGCYGYDRPVSPNLDRMAKEGVLFERAYAHAPFTIPSHASLFTSLYPSVHGVEHKDSGRLPSGVPLMAEILAHHGLETASFNGGGFMSHEFGFDRGFDLYCEVDPLGDRFMDHEMRKKKGCSDGSTGSLNHALSWIEKRKDRPFFLFLHTFMVHDYLPSMELAEAFHEGSNGDLRPSPKTLKKIMRQYRKTRALPQENLDYFINMYDAGIRAADAMVGTLLARLEGLGLMDRTLIVVTSDHGEEFMDHGGMFHGNTVYEEMIRIPLILHVPGITNGAVVEEYVSHVDLLPTVLDLMGFTPKPRLNGRSLAPLLEEGGWKKSPVFAEVNKPGQSKRRCVIRDGWKYIEGSTDPSLNHPASTKVEVFHVEEDPLEREANADLEAKNSLDKLMGKMKKSMKELRKILKLKKAEPSELSPEVIEVLKQQGYL